ncbi:MAG: DEAD/DEAH box helicase [Acidobacteriota bacterium]|nr:DEAD/DEAH box helicase [Acidobacteriota bacterium]
MSMSFADLGVPSNLVERLAARGITEAFPIQEAALPDALEGRDVVGKAVTGSGKTLAFGLPLMARLTKARPRKPHGLVLVPTRELAAQVQKELANLTDDRGRRVICVYGGTSYNVARKALNFGVDVVVACPGRLEDMLEQGAFDLSQITTVVVDEADRMADMGFLPAVRRIMAATPPERHVMLFSATMGPDVKSLVKEFTDDAAVHDVVGEEAPSDVDHFFWRVPRDQRPQFAADIIEEYERAIVFTRTKHGADRLARQLGERGISAVALHGDRTQAQRERALRSVKSGHVQVLVATDVAARGIHIDLLPVVIHYDPPAQATDYLHRSGRTGRAGATGVVISLVGEDAVGQVKRLQRALGVPMSVESREDAPAIRLGAVDDAAAAERIDERGGKGRGERGAPRERHTPARGERGPRSFERRERPTGERGGAARGARNDRDDNGRGYNDRNERPARPERGFNERGGRSMSERNERGARPGRDVADRGERSFADRDRNDRNDRGPRGINDRNERLARPERSAGASKAGHREAVVSFFNDSKGFGFASDDKGDDLFIHFSSIQGDGFKSLSQGQKIIFEEAHGPKGREARNVRVVGGARERRY